MTNPAPLQLQSLRNFCLASADARSLLGDCLLTLTEEAVKMRFFQAAQEMDDLSAFLFSAPADSQDHQQPPEAVAMPLTPATSSGRDLADRAAIFDPLRLQQERTPLKDSATASITAVQRIRGTKGVAGKAYYNTAAWRREYAQRARALLADQAQVDASGFISAIKITDSLEDDLIKSGHFKVVTDESQLTSYGNRPWRNAITETLRAMANAGQLECKRSSYRLPLGIRRAA
jgi:hypothetical protein